MNDRRRGQAADALEALELRERRVAHLGPTDAVFDVPGVRVAVVLPERRVDRVTRVVLVVRRGIRAQLTGQLSAPESDGT